MKSKKIIAFGVLLFMFFFYLSGCMSVREISNGMKWDESLLLSIEKGKTTAKDIAYSFGSPQKEIMGTNGRIWVYFYNRWKYLYDQNMFLGATDTEHHSLSIWFNQDGIVTDYSLYYNEYEDPELTHRWEEYLKNMGSSQQGNFPTRKETNK